MIARLPSHHRNSILQLLPNSTPSFFVVSIKTSTLDIKRSRNWSKSLRLSLLACALDFPQCRTTICSLCRWRRFDTIRMRRTHHCPRSPFRWVLSSVKRGLRSKLHSQRLDQHCKEEWSGRQITQNPRGMQLSRVPLSRVSWRESRYGSCSRNSVMRGHRTLLLRPQSLMPQWIRRTNQRHKAPCRRRSRLSRRIPQRARRAVPNRRSLQGHPRPKRPGKKLNRPQRRLLRRTRNSPRANERHEFPKMPFLVHRSCRNRLRRRIASIISRANVRRGIFAECRHRAKAL